MIISFYSKFEPQVRDNCFLFLFHLWIVKSSSLALLARETNVGVRRGICGMISAIALLEFSNGEWSEVKQVILQVFFQCVNLMVGYSE